MNRDTIRRILWVGSLLAVLIGATLVLIQRGAEWGLGAAP
jgi:hypothetical protein